MAPLVIMGAGGFGREVRDVVEAVNLESGLADTPLFDLRGFLDDDSDQPIEALLGFPPDTRYVIGIGDGQVRRRLDRWATGHGYQAATLVHPAATVGRDVRLGPGSILCAGARLTSNIRLGRHVHVNLNTTIGHDSVLADYVTCFPLVAVSGSVTVGECASIGSGAVIIQGLTVGAGSFVGAGASVIRDVPADVTAVGVPARPH